LARAAWQAESLPRPSDFVLRIRGHQAPQDSDMVCVERRETALCLRQSMDALARRARREERAGRRAARAVRLPDNQGQCDHRPSPSESDARYSNDAGRGRQMARAGDSMHLRCRGRCRMPHCASWRRGRRRTLPPAISISAAASRSGSPFACSAREFPWPFRWRILHVNGSRATVTWRRGRNR
jgi:hypothetical protein